MRKTSPHAPRRAGRRGPGAGTPLALLLLLAAPTAALWMKLEQPPASWVAAWVSAVSLVTFALYAVDKRSAERGGWRQPEAWLHLLEFAGGWPGAFVAQRGLRHKSAKASYQFVFWLIVAAHQLAAVDALLGWPMSRWAQATL